MDLGGGACGRAGTLKEGGQHKHGRLGSRLVAAWLVADSPRKQVLIVYLPPLSVQRDRGIVITL